MTESFVCRRVISNGLAVASLHPKIGPVYFTYTDESDCNNGGFYSVSNYPEDAHYFSASKYRSHSVLSFLNEVLQCNSERCDDYDYDDKTPERRFSWRIQKLAEKAGDTEDDFYNWLRQATWVECLAPPRIVFLEDFNGYDGYRPEWTSNPHGALTFSSEAILDGEDPDIELAASIGCFVPLSAAMELPEHKAGNKIDVHYAIEADYAWTLYRLGLQEPGTRLWVDYRDRAMSFSAAAAREHFKGGESGPISGHITAFPDLQKVFDMSLALVRHLENPAVGAE